MRSRRLLLLAMSGVRVRSRELLELGMTLPGFVERGRAISRLPSLGLLTIAAHTPPAWEVEYAEIDEWTPDDAARIAREGYDLVAISALTARILEAYALADMLRAAGVAVALGGLHVSALPEEAAAHADAVVAGEGEGVWPLVLADLEAGRLRPIYRSSERPFSFAACRVPRYDLLDLDRYDRLTLQTTRGCPLACVFCAASRTISPYRKKPIEQVRRELDAIVERWPRPFVELADDNTFVDAAWSRELVRTLSSYDLRWFTETDVSVADDEPLLDLLAESGCAQLLIGVESTDPATLRGVDPAHWKWRRLEGLRERIARIQSRGIAVDGCFVLGFDGDDASAFDRVREAASVLELAEVQITILTPFPGTPLLARLDREGRLLEDAGWDRRTLFDVTFRPARMTAGELETGFRDLMADLYSPPATARRKTLARRILLSSRRASGAMDATP